MRRAILAVAALVSLGGGLFIPALATPASGPTDALTGGTATVVVTHDPTSGLPVWNFTLSGQIAAGGRVYSGTATGSEFEDNPNAVPMSFSGTAPSGSIAATCTGNFVQTAAQGGSAGSPPESPAGVLEEGCSVSIDGTSNVPLGLVLALAPTADPTTFTGLFGALPDTTGTPAVPVVSFGTASATDSSGPNGSFLSFTFAGQISLGNDTYQGPASGSTSPRPSGLPTFVRVPKFQLSGTSASGSLSATCSGQFQRSGVLVDSPVVGEALSILTCHGAANGGHPGSVTLVGAYLATSQDIHFGVFTQYDGIFVGI
jgi:hypothetical protein